MKPKKKTKKLFQYNGGFAYYAPLALRLLEAKKGFRILWHTEYGNFILEYKGMAKINNCSKITIESAEEIK